MCAEKLVVAIQLENDLNDGLTAVRQALADDPIPAEQGK